MNPRVAWPERKTEQLAQLMLHKLQSGDWAVNQRLPPERSLAAEFHVSRTVVREALVALQLSGHVETRVGDGTYVKAPDASTSLHAELAIIAGLTIAKSLEVREALEMASAYLAMRNATRSEMRTLETYLQSLSAHLQRDDHKPYVMATLDLHVAIARASHNTFLHDTIRELVGQIRDDQWLISDKYSPAIGAYSYHVHRDLINAIVARNAEAAFSAITSHYTDYPVLHHSSDSSKP